MNTGTILGILGLVATIIFGWLSIHLVRARRYPGQITFIIEDVLPLFDSIVRNFSELAVLYKDKPVAEGLILLKGVFVNSGSKDISKDMVSEQITLSLPENHKWHSVKLLSASQSVHGKFEIMDRLLRLDLDLFRCREFIRFEALAEMPISQYHKQSVWNDIRKRFEESLKIQHRIADTQEIKVRKLPDEEFATKRFKKIRIPIVAVVALLIGLLVWSLTHPTTELIYTVASPSGTNTDVRMTPMRDGSLTLKGVQDKNFKKSVSTEAFFKAPNFAVHCASKKDTIYIAFFCLSILVYVVMLIDYYQDVHQARRLRKLFTIVESKQDSD